MKTAFHYSLLFVLLSGLMFSSSRITINKMQCLGSGKVTYSMLEADDCCQPEKGTVSSIYSGCCEFSKITFQTSISELLKPDLSKKIFSTPVFIIKIWSCLPKLTIAADFFRDTSPPLSGSQILTLISIFRF